MSVTILGQVSALSQHSSRAGRSRAARMRLAPQGLRGCFTCVNSTLALGVVPREPSRRRPTPWRLPTVKTSLAKEEEADVAVLAFLSAADVVTISAASWRSYRSAGGLVARRREWALHAGTARQLVVQAELDA
jgi:hypothetical protein